VSDIAVIGAGYVGLTTGVCLAELGHQVRIYDTDETRVDSLQRGRIPFFEPDLEPMFLRHFDAGSVHVTNEPAEAVTPSAFVFLCVPTPGRPDGSADTRYLSAASTMLGPLLASGAIVVNKSTVPVGSTEIVQAHLDRDDTHVVSNPEFLREGSAIADFLQPDRIVIGSDDVDIARRVADLYGSLRAKTVLTDPASAELIKYASNAYLATRLSFVNAVAEACEVLGGDIDRVVQGIGLDTRIGPHFLQPGPGWGGSCFPKDTLALAAMAEANGFAFGFLRAVMESNREHFDRVALKALAMLEDPPSSIVAVWGLAFKAGTDDTRNSPAIEVISRLVAEGVQVVAFDPEARVEVPGMRQADTAIAAATGADMLVVLTEWPAFAEIDPVVVADVLAAPLVLDTRGVLARDHWTAAGFVLRSLGRAFDARTVDDADETA